MKTDKNAFYPAVKRHFTLFAAGYKHIFEEKMAKKCVLFSGERMFLYLCR